MDDALRTINVLLLLRYTMSNAQVISPQNINFDIMVL